MGNRFEFTLPLLCVRSNWFRPISVQHHIHLEQPMQTNILYTLWEKWHMNFHFHFHFPNMRWIVPLIAIFDLFHYNVRATRQKMKTRTVPCVHTKIEKPPIWYQWFWSSNFRTHRSLSLINHDWRFSHTTNAGRQSNDAWSHTHLSRHKCKRWTCI